MMDSRYKFENPWISMYKPYFISLIILLFPWGVQAQTGSYGFDGRLVVQDPLNASNSNTMLAAARCIA